MKFEPTDRLKALPPYLFVEIDRRKRAALEAGRDVINLGVGDPDLPTHPFIVERMRAALDETPHHRYPPDIGTQAFRRSIVRFFGRRYGVELDERTEIHPLIGTKEGLGHLPLATLNPGQGALIPEPGYPVYRSGTIFAGGVPHTMVLRESRGWLPDLEAIPSSVARSCRLIYVNYPNNPTGAVAPRAFYERLVDFARQHDLIVVSDAAYNELYYDDAPPPPSVLEVPGARDLAVELHSCSKTFNMTGWRVGFVAGQPDVIAALARIKANLDSGQFGAIQEAAAVALDGYDRPEVARQRRVYQERRDVLCDGLARLGFGLSRPPATFYVWARTPNASDAMRAATRMLDEAAVVCVPGTGFGAAGEGYVRFALTVDVERLSAAVARISEMHWAGTEGRR